jgi:hypothetical protein
MLLTPSCSDRLAIEHVQPHLLVEERDVALVALYRLAFCAGGRLALGAGKARLGSRAWERRLTRIAETARGLDPEARRWCWSA